MLLSGMEMVRLRRRLMVLALLTSSVWLSAAPAKGDFCETSVVRDYARPLKGLAPLRQPPLDEHLDFAPARVFQPPFLRGAAGGTRGARLPDLLQSIFGRQLRQSPGRLAGDLEPGEDRPARSSPRISADDRKACEEGPGGRGSRSRLPGPGEARDLS